MERVFIFDTTLRDGEQVPGCQLNTIEKIQIAKALEDLAAEGKACPTTEVGDWIAKQIKTQRL